jgi:hypothetical protein
MNNSEQLRQLQKWELNLTLINNTPLNGMFYILTSDWYLYSIDAGTGKTNGASLFSPRDLRRFIDDHWGEIDLTAKALRLYFTDIIRGFDPTARVGMPEDWEDNGNESSL